MIFSVIVPTYNRLESLKKAIEALMNQDFSVDEFEIIVVDDESWDGTGEYLESFWKKGPALTVLSQKHRGPASARNLGISKASGKIIAFTDDDCLVPPGWLSALKKGYENFPKAAGVGGYLEAPQEVLKSNPIAKLESFETRVIYHCGDTPYLGGFESPAGGTNNMSYLRDVIVEIGLFDENFPVPAGEDADLKLRVIEKGYQIGYIPLKVTHLDPYSFEAFIRRGISHGVGSAFFESKHGQRPRAASLIKEVVLLPLTFIKALGRSADLALSLLMTTKSFLMVIGRVKYLYLTKK